VHIKRIHTNRRGLTLIEVLLATALASVLLGVVWTSMDVYQRMQQKGSERSAELRLLRGLYAQLRDDLGTLSIASTEGNKAQRSIDDLLLVPSLDAPTSEAPSSEAVPSGFAPSAFAPSGGATEEGATGGFPATAPLQPDRPSANQVAVYSGFVGRAHGMEMVVVRPRFDGMALPALGTAASSSDPGPAQASMAQNTMARNTMARKVTYRFVAENELHANAISGENGNTMEQADAVPMNDRPVDHDFALEGTELAVLPGGLTRTAEPLMAATFQQSTGSAALSDGLAANAERELSGQRPITEESTLAGVRGETDATLGSSLVTDEPIPEVAWCRFSYFDGRRWRGSWNGSSAARLPLAVAFEFLLDKDLDEIGESGVFLGEPLAGPTVVPTVDTESLASTEVSTTESITDSGPPSGGPMLRRFVFSLLGAGRAPREDKNQQTFPAGHVPPDTYSLK